MVKVMFMKQKWFSRPHRFKNAVTLGLETGLNDRCYIYPICMYDEGLGTPSNYAANPENTSFAVNTGPNCYPESRINLIVSNIRMSLTKGALETDNLHTVRIAFMPIFMSFKEDYTAIDDLTSEEVQDVLQMQTESTDRQGYPLFNGVDIPEKYTNGGILDDNVPGLTTNQRLEGVTFGGIDEYYDMIHYQTNAGKLKSCTGGFKWNVLTRDRPTIQVRIKMRNKTKFMNPYTFFGVMVYLPQAGTAEQIHVTGDTTNIPHVAIDHHTRYNEWNQNFNFKKT